MRQSDAVSPGLSIENPVDALPATAKGILAAARRVLREHGFEGLTIEAVANEANVSRTSIPYHFGSRAGLVQILIDSLFHDLTVDIWRRRLDDPAAGSLDDFLDMVRLEVADIEGQSEFFELMVCALREELLRKRVAELFAGYRTLNADLAGVATPREDATASQDAGAEREALGAVLQAITDGLALQKVMDPDFDVTRAIAVVERLLGPALRDDA